ncbi:MAG: hypothetical protein HAW67_00815 [Endozoicomonadaceae bacterium]|nr:hypothetical protein [Endozoicomonadaceae bacterium]
MKISIGAAHLPAAKQQAYALRDAILSEYYSLSQLYTKSAFLKIWAKCLHANDWGHFNANSQHANKLSKKNVVVCPEVIHLLARSLCRYSFVSETEWYEFARLIYSVAYEHELALFDDEEHEYYNMEFGTPENPILLEVGPEGHNQHVVDLLYQKSSFNEMRESEFIKGLLAYAKKKRQLLSGKATIRNYHLDIYPNSGVSVASVLERAIDAGWVKKVRVYSYKEPEYKIVLTLRAVSTCLKVS